MTQHHNFQAYTVRAWLWRLEYATQEIEAATMDEAEALARGLSWDGEVFADCGSDTVLDEIRVEDNVNDSEESWAVTGGFSAARDRAESLEAINADLLAALKLARDALATTRLPHRDRLAAHEAVCAAIDKAEGSPR